MFTAEDRDALERILIREKATALSDLRDGQRLFGAYGDKRLSLTDRINAAQSRYDTADRLLTLIKEER